MMNAWVYKRYYEGGEFPLEKTTDFKKPSPAPSGHVLIRVLATTVNPVDWKVISGATRYIPSFLGAPPFSEEGTIPCADGIGIVEECGAESPWKVGARVCFDNAPHFGALAEFVIVPESKCCLAPKDSRFSDIDIAASVGLASGTAVMGIKWIFEHVDPSPTKRILILGGSGGVGSAAIQMLHFMGHHVTTTCSARNVEFCTNLGADEIIDYQNEPHFFENVSEPFDAIFQCVGQPGDFGKASFFQAIKEGGAFASCDRSGSLAGTIYYSIVRKIANPVYYKVFLNSPSTENLAFTCSLMDENKDQWKSPICQSFTFDEASEAFDLSRSKKATGKIVVTVNTDAE